TFLTDTMITCEGERHESDAPWGAYGGHDGLNASIVKNPGRDGEESWPAKVTGRQLVAGDSVQITVTSGGGFVNPSKRDAQEVLSAVLAGLTTKVAAGRDFGVVLVETAAGLQVRQAGTEVLRLSALAIEVGQARGSFNIGPWGSLSYRRAAPRAVALSP